MSSDQQEGFAALRDEQYIVLTTFRASGAPVPTTVWFAEVDGKLYITSNSATGKVKRVQQNGRVQVAASDRVGNVHGAALAGVGRVLPLDAPENEAAEAALIAKYGEQLQRIRAMRTEESGTNAVSVHLAVEPAADTITRETA